MQNKTAWKEQGSDKWKPKRLAVAVIIREKNSRRSPLEQLTRKVVRAGWNPFPYQSLSLRREFSTLLGSSAELNCPLRAENFPRKSSGAWGSLLAWRQDFMTFYAPPSIPSPSPYILPRSAFSGGRSFGYPRPAVLSAGRRALQACGVVLPQTVSYFHRQCPTSADSVVHLDEPQHVSEKNHFLVNTRYMIIYSARL